MKFTKEHINNKPFKGIYKKQKNYLLIFLKNKFIIFHILSLKYYYNNIVKCRKSIFTPFLME